ncbi:TIGR03936 family radical SAM-associated protein [Planctomycetota bacterium]
MKYNIMVVIKFRIWGNLRFLSHAETLRLFQRACIRADIGMKYRGGFNPRPKLSLPVPRSVGVESDDELLYFYVEQEINETQKTNYLSEIKAALSAQLPEGCSLLSVEASKTKKPPQFYIVSYVFKTRTNEKLKVSAERLLAKESLPLQRQAGTKTAKAKVVDVRPFLRTIRADKLSGDVADICVECNFSPAGSIRIEEILKLFELNAVDLAEPVRRISIKCN